MENVTKQQLEAMFNARQSELIDEIFLKFNALQKERDSLKSQIVGLNATIQTLSKPKE